MAYHSHLLFGNSSELPERQRWQDCSSRRCSPLCFFDRLINKVSFEKEAFSKKSRNRFKRKALNKKISYNHHGSKRGKRGYRNN